jgi:copper chaperone CopZ
MQPTSAFRAPFLPAYHQMTQENTMAKFTLKIDGMHCGSCVRRVTQALTAVEGVVVDEVRLGSAQITSTVDPAPVDLAIAALAKAGYAAHLEA